MGLTIVDSLDTMIIMNLTDEYRQARAWCEKFQLSTVAEPVNVFETTIRVLGGFLSAYALSGGDRLFRDLAVDLADRLLPSFNTTSGIPVSRYG